ncbi:MAG: glycogen/starch/alpha-glucan phosphorylase [Clostridiales bacterium]|nr:glycogen/starch/alpha-glucan phosphorylase [Clostridiales bacterium]
MPTTQFDKESIKKSIIGKLQRYNGRTLSDATDQQIYHAVASTVRDQIMQKWVAYREKDKQSDGKRLYYLSVEFLTGRSLHCNILNLCSQDNYQQAFEELGLDWRRIFKEEPEPGLGNGGLGRLAACFMDSLASLTLPAMGCTIRYEYGLFRQRILGGQQVEVPDNWLENGNVWEVPAMEDQCEVHFGGWVEPVEENGRMQYRLRDYYTVEAVPYDMPVAGYDCETVNSLRMWRARSPKTIDLASFSSGQYSKAMQEQELATVISKVLYPEDNHYEGKELRLKQHYFFTSATLQYAIKDFKRRFGNNFMMLPEKVTIHVNDTHPGLAIPELMRILMDEEGLGWDEASWIVQHTVAYTNHTVMSEALEKWPEAMMKNLLPRIYMILQEINRRVCARLADHYQNGSDPRIAKMAITAYDMVHMANLCVSMSYSVNGVSQLHGDILKADTFKDYYEFTPEKFSAITNGITHRRWLMACNRGLTQLICDTIGDKWKREPELLRELLPYRDDAAFRAEFEKVKRQNKEIFSNVLMQRQKMSVDPDFMFDVQVKRLHEYKRQLLNALHILVLYNRIMDDPNYTMTPRVFVFGAKASPGYYMAKQIIKLIIAISKLIDKSPRAQKYLRVIFLENYDVSGAEALIPAADLSEQLSTAGKEASGTGCMKFMMNGAVTMGTMDGANVEIHEQVGDDNIYIFGMRADTVSDLYREGTYAPMRIFETNAELRRALTQIIDGTLFPENPAMLQDIYHNLLFKDPYFVLKDFGSYSMAQRRVDADYQNREKWLKMAITNTACSGIFSSDRTIKEYNDLIWHLK